MRHYSLHVAPLEAIPQVIPFQQRCRRDDHGSESDGRKDRLPQRHPVRKHDQNAIACPNPPASEKRRDLRRAPGHFVKGHQVIRP
jgi:hypothetical protein